jgi:CheY-like chemotaxis protein
VDDELIVRRSMARRMRQAGFVVFEAATGAEAILLFRQHQVDLVLLDVDMPQMDGEQTYTELLRQEASARVAFMSGYMDPTRAAHLKTRGALAMLEKPCSLDVIHSLATQRDRASEDETADDIEILTRPE